MSRALRALASLRVRLNSNVLRRAIQGYFPVPPTGASPSTKDKKTKDGLLEFLDEVCILYFSGIFKLNSFAICI